MRSLGSTRRKRRGVSMAGSLAALVALLLTVTPSPQAAGSTESGTPSRGQLALVLDSSGSMADPASPGVTKIDAAKDAVREVVERLPEDVDVGLRVFGAEVFEQGQPGACEDTQNVVPVGPVDGNAIARAVAEYEPFGETPIGNALRGAAQDLQDAGETAGPRTVVLLSDGEPTCAPDPCDVAEELADSDIGIRINVVGLNVTGEARRVLRCIAREGNGQYFDAESAAGVTVGLVRAGVRGLQGFQLGGTAVTGGTSLADALPLAPGQYMDSSPGGDGARFYSFGTPPGGGVAASALMRPPAGRPGFTAGMSMQLMTPEGEPCGSDEAGKAPSPGYSPLTSVGLEHNQLSGGPDDPCQTASQMVMAIAIDEPGVDFGFTMEATQPILNEDELPAPVEDHGKGPWAEALPVSGGPEATPVVGGIALADAALLEPGVTYSDSIAAPEQIVYRIPLEYGEAARVSAQIEADPRAASATGRDGNPVTLRSLSSLASPFPLAEGSGGATGRARYTGSEPQRVGAYVSPIRARNVQSSAASVRGNSRSGFVYVVLGLGNTSGSLASVPVSLRVDVVGEAAGEPEFATPLTSPSPGAAEGDGGGLPPLWLMIVAGLVVAYIAMRASVLVLTTRGGPGDPGMP